MSWFIQKLNYLIVLGGKGSGWRFQIKVTIPSLLQMCVIKKNALKDSRQIGAFLSISKTMRRKNVFFSITLNVFFIEPFHNEGCRTYLGKSRSL